MHTTRTLVSLLLIACGGCVPIVQDSAAPKLSSIAWSGSIETGAPADTQLAKLLNEPELTSLTVQALRHNSDIRIATARVKQTQALLRAARQSGLPQVSAAAGGTKSFNGSRIDPLAISNTFVTLDVDLDFDLFGRLSANRYAAISRARATALQRDAVILAIETDVASAYVQYAVLARRIAILDNNIERAIELDRVIRVRAEEGAATRVDRGLQAIRLLILREEGSRLRQALDQTRTALAILTGSEAPQFFLAVPDLDKVTVPRLNPPPPAVLLSARPDIRASEAFIEAEKGNVAQARAAFFPQVGLSLRGLLETVAGSPLGSSLSLGSTLLAPIFNRGQLESEFLLASAVQLESVERYRQTILTALAEVENARSAGLRSAERAALLSSIVEEARITAHIANIQYIEGDEDINTLLDSETNLSAAEDASIINRQDELLSQIFLYRAMGGFNKSEGDFRSR